MKLWLLRPIHRKNDDPWEPWYDKYFGFVISAPDETAARKLAHDQDGDENRGEFLGRKIAETKTPWLESYYSTCVELKPTKKIEVIIEDFARS